MDFGIDGLPDNSIGFIEGYLMQDIEDIKLRVSFHSYLNYSDEAFLKAFSAWVEHIWGYGKYSRKSWRNDYIMAMGLAGECGEVLELLKKHARDPKKNILDKEKLKEEMGDVLYYIVKLANRYEIPLKEIIQTNFKKLEERYVNKVRERNTRKSKRRSTSIKRRTRKTVTKSKARNPFHEKSEQLKESFCPQCGFSHNKIMEGCLREVFCCDCGFGHVPGYKDCVVIKNPC